MPRCVLAVPSCLRTIPSWLFATPCCDFARRRGVFSFPSTLRADPSRLRAVPGVSEPGAVSDPISQKAPIQDGIEPSSGSAYCPVVTARSAVADSVSTICSRAVSVCNRFSNAALTNEANSGCGASGFDLNSGWN